VKFENVPAPGFLLQPVYILGYYVLKETAFFQRGEVGVGEGGPDIIFDADEIPGVRVENARVFQEGSMSNTFGGYWPVV